MNEPDTSFLTELPRRPAPGASADFNACVLSGVRRCRRQAARRRAVAVGVLPLLLLLGGFVGLRMREQDSRGNAARAGTHWLLAQQQPDGAWPAAEWGGHPQFSSGITALATLALLHAPDGAPAEALASAGNWLAEHLDPHASLSTEGPGLYNHLFTLQALLELDSRAPSPERRGLLRQSLTGLMRQQQADGGWGYASPEPMGYGPLSHSRSNSAVTWWVLRILRQAESLGFPLRPGALARGDTWLANCFPPGGPAYLPDSPATGPDTALFWMAQLSGTRAQPPPAAVEAADAYRDLFRMQALAGAAPYGDVIRRQQADGAWLPLHDRWASAGGQIYTTAACVLALAPPRATL